jgi:hypothetical protein
MFVYNINHAVFFIHKTKNIPISDVILVFLDCPMIFLSWWDSLSKTRVQPRFVTH